MADYDLLPVSHDPFTAPPSDLIPVDHDPFSAGPQLERIPPQMNVPAQQNWGAQAGVNVLGSLTGLDYVGRVMRGEVSEQEQRDMLPMLAIGAIAPGLGKAEGKLVIDQLTMKRGDQHLSVSGVVTLDEQRRPSGKVDLAATGLRDLLKQTDMGQLADMMAGDVRLPLTMTKGRLLMGPLKLADLQPLY